MCCAAWGEDTYSWVKTAPTGLATGDIVVIVDQTSSTAMSNNNGTQSAPAATEVTLSNDKSQISSPGETIQWTVTVTENGYQFGVGDNFLYCTAINNGVRVGTNDNNTFNWEQADANNEEYYLFNTATSRYIGVYNNQDWRCYSTVNNNIKDTRTAIYKRVSNVEPVDPIYPEVTLEKDEIKVGETIKIKYPSDLPDVTFESDNTSVATVDENGVITGKSQGGAWIYMSWEDDDNYIGGDKYFEIGVSKNDAEVTLSSDNIKVGNTATISYPDDLVAIRFESDNEDVATVSEDGVITGVSVGEATITAEWGGTNDIKYNKGTAIYTINVTDPSSLPVYVKVTNLNQVVAGNKYILVTEGGMAMGAQDGNFRKEVEVTLDGNQAYVGDDVAVLTLGGKAGAWTFSPSDTEGELSFINDDNNYLVTKTDATDAEKLWRISNDFQVWHRAFPARTIQDNTDAAHFGCFRNTQAPSYLYVEQGSDIDENYKKDPMLSIANAFLELGSGSKKPKVSTPSDGTITYSDFDSDIVTFTDGNMEAVSEGTTTVTATLEATDEYEGDVTTFIITVVPAHSNMASHLYKKVTSDDDLTVGKYLIVYEEGSVAFNGGLPTLDAVGNVIDVTLNNDKIFCDEDAYFLIDPDAGTLRSASGYYIGITGTSNGLRTSEDADTYTNDISIDEHEDAVIKAGTMTLRFNNTSNQNRFRYYRSGQQAIQLYKAVDPFSFSIKEQASDGYDHYATISALGSEEYYQVSGGAEVFTLTVDNHKLVLSAPFTDGDVIPSKDANGANAAYLVRGVPGDYEFTAAATPKEEVQLGENMLVSTGENGVTAEEMAAAHEDGYVFYKLSLSPKTGKLGFLRGTTDGAAFNYKSGHQAYLAVPPTALASQVSAYYFDETTEINEVRSEGVAPSDEIYTLSGVRMEGAALPKGIYIVNGKKMVVK